MKKIYNISEFKEKRRKKINQPIRREKQHQLSNKQQQLQQKENSEQLPLFLCRFLLVQTPPTFNQKEIEAKQA